ncbi:MAG: methyl-accepting chemotaxis protein [Alcanivorax sp.]
MFSKLKISQKILAVVMLQIIVLVAATVYGFYVEFNHTFKQEVAAAQKKNIRVAATVLKRDYPNITFEFDKTDHHITQIIAKGDMPSFQDNTLIDEVGHITGETATVFVWDEETQDYWRKTTNIIKNDGKRAVGTPLGQKGRVYPIIREGKVYEGEATILGKDYYTLYQPIFSDKGNVVGILYVGLSKAQFEQYLWGGLRSVMVIAFIIALLGLVTITLTIRVILTKNLTRMTQQMTALADGNLDIEIAGIQRQDEIGEMARTVQIFKDNAIAKLDAEQKQKETEANAEQDRKRALQKIAKDFDSNIGGLIASLSSASGQLQTTAETMRDVADKTSGDSETVSQSSNEASQNVNTVASAMEEMSASSGEIAVQMSSVKSKSTDTAQNAQEANQTVANLDKLADNIGEVITAIQDIAEQTNLLALNATIEAARAGEAGKGFAVVADEVKKLANETSQKTEEISGRINDIQNATKASVGAMEKIIANISDIDESVTGVSAAVEEQNATTQEIVRSISDASNGVLNVSKIIEDVKKGAEDTGLSSDAVLNAAREVAKLSDNLKNSVDEFLSEISADK